MSRMSDRAKAREKEIKAGSKAAGKKEAVSVKKWKRDKCPTCHVVDCPGGEKCRRAAGQESYNDRTKSRQPAKAKEKKKKTLSWGETRRIRKDAEAAYRRGHPAASDGQVRRAGTDAVKAAKRKLK